jgi:hypothetical protein
MDEFKGTPGPWRFSLSKRRAYISGVHWDNFAKVVVKMETEKIYSVQGIANAKLIAAAPDLLSALQNLVHLHMCEQEGLSSGQPSPTDWMEAVDNASNAIGKALGREASDGTT